MENNQTYAEFVRKFYPEATDEIITRILIDCNIGPWTFVNLEDLERQIKAWIETEAKEAI